MYTYRLIEINSEQLTWFETNKRYEVGDEVDWPVKSNKGKVWIVVRKIE